MVHNGLDSPNFNAFVIKTTNAFQSKFDDNVRLICALKCKYNILSKYRNIYFSFVLSAPNCIIMCIKMQKRFKRLFANNATPHEYESLCALVCAFTGNSSMKQEILNRKINFVENFAKS